MTDLAHYLHAYHTHKQSVCLYLFYKCHSHSFTSTFMKPSVSLLCSQDPDNGLYTEPDYSSPWCISSCNIIPLLGLQNNLSCIVILTKLFSSFTVSSPLTSQQAWFHFQYIMCSLYELANVETSLFKLTYRVPVLGDIQFESSGEEGI